MARNDVKERVQNLFREVFDMSDLVVNDSTIASDVEGWDSMAHITLVHVMEEEFGIRFKTEEIGSLKNVGEFIDSIVEKLETK